MKAKIKPNILSFLPIALMCVIISVSGCGGSSWLDERMDEADRLMESHPDSALAILDSIHPAIINNKEPKARYALLKSMALDKNYIDKTTFEILQPAIDHYYKKGTPDEKLKTYYYQGRIYQNANDFDRALYVITRGLDEADKCRDSLTIARALVMRGMLYKNLYDYEGYLNNYIKAARIYCRKNKQSYEFDCLLNVLNGALVLNRNELADSVIKKLRKFEHLNDAQVQALNGQVLSYVLKLGSEQDLNELMTHKKDSYCQSANGILNLARAYHRIEDNTMALRQLNYLDEIRAPYDTFKYLSIKHPILESLGMYQDALDTYKEFSQRLETFNSAKFEQKSRSMEERHQLELQAEKEARRHAKTILELAGGIGLLLMLLITALLMIRSQRIKHHLAEEKARAAALENENLKSEKERLGLANENLQLERDKKALEAENLAHRVDELEREGEGLKELLESREEMPEEVRKAIRKRVEMLNSYLASQISDHKEFEKAYDTWVEELTANKEEFMDSNRLAFQASHPAFIKYFEEHGLTTAEINYVCLYAIGLRGKDVGNYMKMRSHVNVSSAIRRKLGIDQHETNIGIYVRKKLREF